MAALDGQPGVLKVTKGWRRFKEINRVVYDHQQITIERMEGLLKAAGTYIATVKEGGGEWGPDRMVRD